MGSPPVCFSRRNHTLGAGNIQRRVGQVERIGPFQTSGAFSDARTLQQPRGREVRGSLERAPEAIGNGIGEGCRGGTPLADTHSLLSSPDVLYSLYHNLIVRSTWVSTRQVQKSWVGEKDPKPAAPRRWRSGGRESGPHRLWYERRQVLADTTDSGLGLSRRRAAATTRRRQSGRAGSRARCVQLIEVALGFVGVGVPVDGQEVVHSGAGS